MNINKEKVGEVAVLGLDGRLNITTTALLEDAFKALLDEGQTKILLDCLNLEYISSAGLRVLLSAAKQFKKINGDIVLSALTNDVKQVFDISGFSSIFSIYESADEAIRNM